MTAKKTLKTLYKEFKKGNSFNKAEISYLIIQVKKDHPELSNYNQSLYLDTKKFIRNYIKSADRKDYGYDKIDIEKLISAIECISNDKERYGLCSNTVRLINLSGHESELNEFMGFRDRCRTLSLKSDKTIRSYFTLLSHLCSYNLKIISLILLTIFIFSYVLFLPAYSEKFEFFILNYQAYSENFYFNHLLNLISLTFGLESDKIIIPLNWLGVIILAFLKSLYVVIILNYLYQKILNIIYAN